MVYYSRVSAVNGAGHQSQFVVSDGFTFDNTPPEPLGHTITRNLVKDGSFETKNLHSHWKSSTGAHHWTRMAKDGIKSVVIKESLFQVIPAGRSDKVRVTYWVAPVNDNSTLQDNLGTAGIGHNSQTFIVKKTHPQWQRHVFYAHVNPYSNITLSFRAMSDGHRFLLDSVSVHGISHDEASWSECIKVEVNPIMDRSTCYITATWRLHDPESGIAEYQWAVGTVKGQ